MSRRAVSCVYFVSKMLPASLLTILAGCTADQPTAPVERLPAPPPSRVLSTCNSSNANSAVGGLVRFYNCGQKVRFVRYVDGTPGNGVADSSGTAAMMTSIESQEGAWNNGPLAPVDLGLPQLVPSTNQGAAYQVLVKFSGGSGPRWCGQVRAANGGSLGPGSPPVELLLGLGDCGSLNEVNRHEIAHVLGILATGISSTNWHKKSPTVFGHCTVSISSPGLILAQAMCPHLKEIMYGLYGVITRPINPSMHIVTTIRGIASLSLVAGQTGSVAAPSLGVSGANVTLCDPTASGDELVQTCEGAEVASGYTVSYGTSNSGVASVNSSGVVTAVGPGTATITRTVTALPTQYQTSSVISGGSVAITVTPAPALAVITAGDGLSFAAGAVVTPSPTVRVLAADGVTPVANVPVTFGSPSGGSSLSGTSQTTNATGYATVGSWTLGAGTGTYTMVATVGASVTPNPLTFHASVSVTPPSGFTVDRAGCRDKGTSVSYKLVWIRGAGATYQIRHANVNDVSQGTLMSSGPATTTSVVTPFYSKSTPPLVHYWWLRELNAGGTATGPWIPNAINSQTAADGCII